MGRSAFQDCTNLTSVTIGDNINVGSSSQEIGYMAFKNCTNLTDVFIGHTVRIIGAEAFHGCSRLTTVTIPNTVTSIGIYVFSGCSNLASITVESGNLNYDSRNNCNAIIKTNTNTLISGCKNTVIPNSVTSIGEFAFYQCYSLTSISIPNSVTAISNYAFEECNNLTNVTIPNSVTTIGSSAFSGCSGLTSVTIPNSVTSIGGAAFSGCSVLNDVFSLIDDPATVSMAYSVFAGNPSNYAERTLHVPVGTVSAYQTDTKWSQYFGSIVEISIPATSIELDQTNAIIYKDDVLQLTATVLPEDATSKVVSWTSSDEAVARVNINGLVTALAAGNATITATTTDGSNLSACCNVTVKQLVTSISMNKSNTTICVGDTEQLTATVFPDDAPDKTVTWKSSNTSVATVNSSGLVTALAAGDATITATTNDGSNLSASCDVTVRQLVTSISLNKTNTTIYVGGTEQLTATLYPDDATDKALTWKSSNTSVATVNSSGLVTALAAGEATITATTNDGSNLSASCNITVKQLVTSISLNKTNSTICVGNTVQLTATVYPDNATDKTVTWISSNTSVATVNSSGLVTAFAVGDATITATTNDGSNLSATCAFTVESIITFADANVKALCVQNWDANGDGELSYNEAASVTDLGTVFKSNKNITSFGELQYFTGLTSIGGYAFYVCSGLTSVTIPNSVTSIGYSAFSYCSRLTSVTIPNSVTSIGDYAFYDCSGLTSVTLPNSVTSISDYTFSGCSGLTSLTIPNSVILIGNYAFSDCSGLTSLTIPNSVTTIGNHAFQSCRGLTSVTIPNSITHIGSDVFCACTGLTSVDIPNSVTSIGYGAFYECSGLINIDIPNSVVSIGEEAFSRCTKLASVTIPNSVTYIGPQAFDRCRCLTSIIIPNSVTYIGYDAFWGCSSLKDVYTHIVDPYIIDMGSCVFELDPSNYAGRTLHVVDGSIALYQANIKWSKYFENIVEISNYLTMADLSVSHGKTIVIPVVMFNTENIIAFQTDLFLPDGLEILQEDGEYMIDPSGRMTRTHSIMSNEVSSGAVRVICYSSNYKPFTGNSGDDLFYITVKVADDAEGDYIIQLKNSLLTNSDFVDLVAPDVAANINVKAYLLGDANNSGTVTVTDVVVTAQYVLEMSPNPFVFEAADVNMDNNITVADVSRIAWMVLNPTLNAPLLRAPALWNNSDRMSGEGFSLNVGETRTVSIALDNEMLYSAFQLDLTLPDGLSASNFCLTHRAGSHAFDVNTLENGKTRALCYSPVLTAISGNEGALLTFDVTATGNVNGDIMVDGIEMVTTDCQSVLLDGFTIGVNSETSVSEQVAGKSVAKVEYFNVAGQQIDRPISGVTLVVTTYTDGTRTTTKVIR